MKNTVRQLQVVSNDPEAEKLPEDLDLRKMTGPEALKFLLAQGIQVVPSDMQYIGGSWRY